MPPQRQTIKAPFDLLTSGNEMAKCHPRLHHLHRPLFDLHASGNSEMGQLPLQSTNARTAIRAHLSHNGLNEMEQLLHKSTKLSMSARSSIGPSPSRESFDDDCFLHTKAIAKPLFPQIQSPIRHIRRWPLGDMIYPPSAANLGRIFIGKPTKPLAWGAESVRFALAAVQACKVPQIKLSYLIHTSLTS